MEWSVLLLCRGTLVQNIMVVYGIECVIAVSWPSCTEHNGCVYDMECNIALSWYSGTEHNGSVWYGVCYCCIMALLYRT